MSNAQKSALFKVGIFSPSKFSLSARKIDKDLWEIHYEETLDIQDKKMFAEVLATTKQAMDPIVKQIGGKEIMIDGNNISYTVTGNIEMIAGILMGELMTISSIGNLTLRDMMLLAGMGLPVMKKLQQKPEKKEVQQ